MKEVAAARRVLQSANRVVVLTGAGISAESGVPTFRGEGGLWKNYRAEELATPQAFARDPQLVWEWYDWRRKKIAQCIPNPAHRAIARWCLSNPNVTLITQNVDGLHELAALDEAGDSTLPAHARPLELHGSIFHVRCTKCHRQTPHRGAVNAASAATLPRCHLCDGLLRPAVVWFGESLESGVLSAAMEAAQRAEACLVVGTSSVVQPAASLPLVTAERGGLLVEINPEETPLSRAASVILRSPAAAVLPEILFF